MAKRPNNDNGKLTKRQEMQIINACLDKMIRDLDEASAAVRKAIEHCPKKD